MKKIFVCKKKMFYTKSRIWKIPNLSTDADRSTDTKRNLFGDVWTDIRKYGHTKRGGGGQMSCSCAKTLQEALDVLHRKGVDFDQFMVISVL